MRFLVISSCGESLGLCYLLKQDGHEVDFWSKNKVLSQFVNQVHSIQDGIRLDPDVILFDSAGLGDEADGLKKMGYNVLATGAWGDKLANDRKFSNKAMESFGIKAPASYAFSNLRDAIDFVGSHKKLLVFKYDGKEGHTFIPKRQDELMSFLVRLLNHDEYKGKVFLQEYIQGTPFATEVWYSKGIPLALPLSHISTNTLMHGDNGVRTDIQTSLSFAYPKREPKIIQQSLKKIGLFVERIGYTGPLSIEGIAKNGKFYGLNFGPSIRFPYLHSTARILGEPLGEFLFRVAQGTTKDINFTQDHFGHSMRVTMHPYPIKDGLKNCAHHEVFGLGRSEIGSSFVPVDTYFDSNNAMYTGMTNGVIGYTTGYGPDVLTADREAFMTFKKLRVPNKQARLDGAKIGLTRLDELRWQGYEVPPFIKPGRGAHEEVSFGVMPGVMVASMGTA